MNDKDIELIKSVMQTVTSASQQGFNSLVYWHMLDGALSVVGYLITAFGAIWLLKMAFKWKPKEDEGKLVRGVSIVILCVALFAIICGIEHSLVDLLAPEGAAIHSILAK